MDSRKRWNNCSRRCAGFCSVLSALGRLDREMKPWWEPLWSKWGPIQQSMKVLDAKAEVDNKWTTLENIQLGSSTVKSKGEVVYKTQKEGRIVHWSRLQTTKWKDEQFTSLFWWICATSSMRTSSRVVSNTKVELSYAETLQKTRRCTKPTFFGTGCVCVASGRGQVSW